MFEDKEVERKQKSFLFESRAIINEWDKHSWELSNFLLFLMFGYLFIIYSYSEHFSNFP